MASPMEFWGVEVKGKEPCKVTIDQGSIIHLSQATLGEAKKDKETVIVHVKVGDKKLVLGMLSQENPHLSFDLVFDEEFEITHSWKNGTVHLLGYQTDVHDQGVEFTDSEDEDEEIPVAKENGQVPVAAEKALAAKPKAAAKPKTDDSDEDDSAEDDGSSADEDDSDDEEMGSDSDDEEVSEDEKPAPVANSGKKRATPEVKTPLQSKKAKVATPTPQKTDGKKGAIVHPSTPHPSKKGGKTPEKSPKSGGSEVACGSCKKTFKSDVALQSHSKAKHGDK